MTDGCCAKSQADRAMKSRASNNLSSQSKIMDKSGMNGRQGNRKGPQDGSGHRGKGKQNG